MASIDPGVRVFWYPNDPDAHIQRAGAEKMPKSVNLTSRCTTVSWTDSVTPPYTQIQLQIQVNRGGLLRRTWPRAGDWVAITNQEGGALSFGYVTGAQGAMSVDNATGGPIVTPISVTAIGWMDWLARVACIVSPGFTDAMAVGTVMTTKYWYNDVFKALKKMITNVTGPGAALETAIPLLLRCQLPPGMGNAMLGDVVQVVHNRATQTAKAPRRVVEGIPGVSMTALQSLQGPTGASVLSLIQGTWAADPNMFEMFPSLEPPAMFHDGTDQIPPPRTGSWGGGQLQRDTAWDKGGQHEGSVSTPKPDGLKVAQGLKRNVCLIYRVRPWRTEPLSEFVQRCVALGSSPLPLMVAGFGEQITWAANGLHAVSRDELYGWQWSVSDEKEVNVTTADLPMGDSLIKFLGAAGLPLLQPGSSILRHGARVMQPSFTFYPRFSSTDENRRDLRKGVLETLASISAQCAQFAMNMARFMEGTIDCAYRPDIRHGDCFSIEMPEGVFPTAMTTASAKTGITPDAASYMGDAHPGYMTAYAEKVTHVVSMMGDRVVRKTKVTYSRGLLRGEGRPTLAAIDGSLDILDDHTTMDDGAVGDLE